MLLHQHRVAVRVHNDKAPRPGCSFNGFGHELRALGLEFPLEVAHISEGIQHFSVLAPARVERQHVLLKHPLEEANYGLAVLEDQPVLGDVATETGEAQFLVKRS
ncbi:hypothetical protein ABIB17_001519 [Arthrobacter sp. UYEF6]